MRIGGKTCVLESLTHGVHTSLMLSWEPGRVTPSSASLLLPVRDKWSGTWSCRRQQLSPGVIAAGCLNRT